MAETKSKADWTAESAMWTLIRAEEIKADKKLFAAAQRALIRQQEIVKRAIIKTKKK